MPAAWTWVHLDELLDYHRLAGYGVLQPGPDLDTGVPMMRVCDIRGTRPVGETKRGWEPGHRPCDRGAHTGWIAIAGWEVYPAPWSSGPLYRDRATRPGFAGAGSGGVP